MIDNEKRRPGRPRVTLPREALALLETLASYHCSAEEIQAGLEAAGYSIGLRTLWRSFGTLIKRQRGAAKTALRRAQWKTALDGNVTMLIWLGKQELGQRDREREQYRPDAPQQGEERVRQVTVLFGKEIEF